MEKISAQTLFQKLEERKRIELEAVQSQTSELLKLHESSLISLSKSAQSTTENITNDLNQRLENALINQMTLINGKATELNTVLDDQVTLIKGQRDELKTILGKPLVLTKKQTEDLNQQILELTATTRKRLGWLMFWPVSLSVLVSLLIWAGVGFWAAWTVEKTNRQAEKILSDQRTHLDSMNREFCSSPAGLKLCTSKK